MHTGRSAWCSVMTWRAEVRVWDGVGGVGVAAFKRGRI